LDGSSRASASEGAADCLARSSMALYDPLPKFSVV
jgi:hypothetical protein